MDYNNLNLYLVNYLYTIFICNIVFFKEILCEDLVSFYAYSQEKKKVKILISPFKRNIFSKEKGNIYIYIYILQQIFKSFVTFSFILEKDDLELCSYYNKKQYLFFSSAFVS